MSRGRGLVVVVALILGLLVGGYLARPLTGQARSILPPPGGVPAGYSILGSTSDSPPGYTWTDIIPRSDGEAWNAESPMPTARLRPASAVVGEKIFAFEGDNRGGTIFTTNEEYNTATNGWSTRAPTTFPRIEPVAAATDGLVFLIGGASISGESGINTNEAYDPGTNTWSTRAAMPTPRASCAAAVLDGRIYVVGGVTGIHGSKLSVNEEYDPVTDTWRSRASMFTARANPSATVVNGKIYVIGGYGGGPTGAVEVYDPQTDTWSSHAPMPTPRTQAAIGTVQGKIYVIGGDRAIGSPTNITEEYDPATDSWQSRLPMPTSRYGAAFGVVGQTMYVIGGFNESVVLSTNEAFTPVALPPFFVHTKN